MKLVMNELILAFDLSHSRVTLTDAIVELYDREIERIRNQLRESEAEYFDLDNDPCAKDFALLTHRFIPVGAEFVTPDGGLPRRVLLRSGLSALWFVLAKAKGFAPFFEFHVHPRALGEFNPDGFERTYRRLGELLRANPTIKGLTSASWFFDPQLRTISPRLAYLRDVPERHGARFFLVEEDREGKSGALSKSEARLRLFREGKYVPRVYLRVWTRQDIINW